MTRLVPRARYELTRCPVCDSPDAAEIADRDTIRAEVERLWAFHGTRLRAGVPPRFLLDRVAFSQDPPIRLATCRVCTHLYRNPLERAESLAAAYDDAAPEDAVLDALFETQRAAYESQAARLTRVAGRPGRGLEVGSYVGGFLAAAREWGWAFQGVDASERVCAFAARRGLAVTYGTIETVRASRPFDAIAIWNTFEQLPHSRQAVATARRLLSPGGVLVVRIPNGAFYMRWRRRLTGALSGVAERVLAHNNLLSFPYRQGFTRASLTRLLREGGFEIARTVGDTLVPIADEWTTRRGALEERVVKRIERVAQHGWHAPWVEVYARLTT